MGPLPNRETDAGLTSREVAVRMKKKTRLQLKREMQFKPPTNRPGVRFVSP
jgi:hypothetical protein